MLENLKLISAGAGSGKTYRLTQEMAGMLTSGEVRPTGIIATTFTKRAAAELKERVRVKLLREGMTREANELTNALIGTVHGLGVKLLRRFAYEAGVSPQIDIIAEGDEQRMFNLSMAQVISLDRIERIEALCDRLSMTDRYGNPHDWRGDVRRMVEVIRGNNFTLADVERSRRRNWETLATFLPTPGTLTADRLSARAERLLAETIAALENNDNDGTKKTSDAARQLNGWLRELKLRGTLPWATYATLSQYTKKVGAKSRGLVEELVELGRAHPTLPAFQDDLREYLDLMYGCAHDAIAEYDRYKKQRGRIDYTDMEVLVLGLLDHEGVRQTLARELDLLMVDEFQDTSPIQLAIFLRLSELARRSVWVGDPKQSIYGFRGAEPRLMAAVMVANGPIDPANIQRNSWRSREDVVYACNSLFTNAFPEFASEQVALNPVRRRAGTQFSPPESPELAEEAGIHHWHFSIDGGGRYSKGFLNDSLGKAIRELLANPPLIMPKGETNERPLRPSDIAILCRSNYACSDMADALAKQGIPAAIARDGLLQTAEATFLLACLKYILNGNDSLSIAEILLFGGRHHLHRIVGDRLAYLQTHREDEDAERSPWSAQEKLLQRLDTLRDATAEHSTSEMLNIVLEQMGLRRIAVSWGDGEQRLSNIDELRRLAVTYEENCHHLHRAASLGGYLLYLDQLSRGGDDRQGSSERPQAVNVLTYHKSKGLEWPLVVCYNLDQKLRADVWGLAVEPDDPEAPVDLANPLSGRWVRLWVNPYGSGGANLDWLAATEESDIQRRATADARAEEARLLYVGCTRARDYLVFPTGKPGSPWVDRVYARGGTQTTVLAPDTTETPFSWDGHDVDKVFRQWLEPKVQPAYDSQTYAVPFIDGHRPGRQSHPAHWIDEAWLTAYAKSVPAPAAHHQYAEPDPDPAVDPRGYANVIEQLINESYGQGSSANGDAYRRELAGRLLDIHCPGGLCDADRLIEVAGHFRNFAANHWPDATVERNVYLRGRVADRYYAGTIGWVGRLPTGEVILIDHFNLAADQFKQRERLHLAELKLRAELFSRLEGRPVAAAFAHLPAAGLLTELRP